MSHSGKILDGNGIFVSTCHKIRRNSYSKTVGEIKSMPKRSKGVGYYANSTFDIAW